MIRNELKNPIQLDRSEVDSSPARQASPWWLDGLWMSFSIAGTELSLHYLLVFLNMHLSAWLESVVHGLAIASVTGPIFAWTLYRRQIETQLAKPNFQLDASPHRYVRLAMIFSMFLIASVTVIGLGSQFRLTQNSQVSSDLEHLTKDQARTAEQLRWLMDSYDDDLLHVDAFRSQLASLDGQQEPIEQMEALERLLTSTDSKSADNAEIWEQICASRLQYQQLVADARSFLNEAKDSDSRADLLNGIRSHIGDFDRSTTELRQQILAYKEKLHAIGTQSSLWLLGIVLGMVSLLLLLLIEPITRLLRRQHLALAVKSAEYERLATIAERTTNAVVMTDANRRITWVNDGFTRISGLHLRRCLRAIPGEILQFEKTDRETVAQMRAAIHAGRSFRGEVLNRGKDGREYWLDIDIQPTFDRNGEINGFMAIESEITFQVLEREHLRSILSSIAEGIVLINTAGVIVESNSAAERIFAMPSDKILGRTSMDPRWGAIREDGTPLGFDEHPTHITLQTGRRVRNFVHGIRTPDGQIRWISMSSTEPLRDAEGDIHAVVASFADITELRPSNSGRYDHSGRGARNLGLACTNRTRSIQRTVGDYVGLYTGGIAAKSRDL